MNLRLSSFELTLLICLLMSTSAVYVTFSTFFTDMRNRREEENEELFLDDDGNHIYYERSIIRKKQYLRMHPEIREEELRTMTRFFRRIKFTRFLKKFL